MLNGVRLLALGAAVCLGITSAFPQSLRQAADSRGILIGTAVHPSLLRSEARYAATVGREFNMVEAEDAMKWAALRPTRDAFDFLLADQLVAFAETHRMKVRGHTLVWGWWNPEWVKDLQATPDQLSEILREHIARVVGHFRGKVFAWDVLNEGIDEHGKLRSSIWYDQPGIGFAGKGTAYIEQCFRWAHEADPEALLFYNDGGGETVNAKSDALFEMVRDFRKRGVPIDGVGLQMHTFDLHPDVEGIRKNIARFSALGVQVHITELDVALPVGADGEASAADLAKQAEIYRQIAAACLESRGCTAIQTWGFTDKWSWVGSRTKHTQGAALLFDRNYAPKLAFGALRDAVAAKPVSSSATPLP
jgi:endo-1,4-beta-xylanase